MPLPLIALLAFRPETLRLETSPSEPPRILVAPLAPLKKDGPLPNSSIGDQLANQFDEDGRAQPIVWGMTDVAFRTAALEGKLGDVPVLPTRAQAIEVGRKLGTAYVLIYRSERKEGRLDATAELVQDGRTLWKDSKNMSATHGSVANDADTAASIARTWLLLMTTGPLKSLTPKKTAATPPPTEGQSPIIVAEPPVLPPPTTNLEALEARLAALAKGGKGGEALAIARDAVDADPLSPGPRNVLVRLLAAQGDVAGAAEEARRAAALMPDQPALRTDAVRRLLAIGKVGEAKSALTGLADTPDTRRLSAEIALSEGDAEETIRSVEPILKAGDDPQARLLRGLARAALGGGEGAAADLKAWSAATSDPLARAEGYAFAGRVLGAMAERAADAMLPLLTRAGAQPKSGAVRDQLDEAQRQAQARSAAWAALTPPPGSQAAYDAWAFAHRLMALMAADLRAFLAGSEEALGSARINLGEAKRAMKEAREKGG